MFYSFSPVLTLEKIFNIICLINSSEELFFLLQISRGHPSKKFISNESLSGSFKTFIKVRDNIIVNERKKRMKKTKEEAN